MALVTPGIVSISGHEGCLFYRVHFLTVRIKVPPKLGYTFLANIYIYIK